MLQDKSPDCILGVFMCSPKTQTHLTTEMHRFGALKILLIVKQ